MSAKERARERAARARKAAENATVSSGRVECARQSPEAMAARTELTLLSRNVAKAPKAPPVPAIERSDLPLPRRAVSADGKREFPSRACTHPEDTGALPEALRQAGLHEASVVSDSTRLVESANARLDKVERRLHQREIDAARDVSNAERVYEVLTPYVRAAFQNEDSETLATLAPLAVKATSNLDRARLSMRNAIAEARKLERSRGAGPRTRERDHKKTYEPAVFGTGEEE